MYMICDTGQPPGAARFDCNSIWAIEPAKTAEISR
jgi:hypothetical protein